VTAASLARGVRQGGAKAGVSLVNKPRDHFTNSPSSAAAAARQVDSDDDDDVDLPSVLASGEIVATQHAVREASVSGSAAVTPARVVVTSSERSASHSRVRGPFQGRPCVRDTSLFAPGTPQDPMAGVATGEHSPPRRSDAFLLQLLDEQGSPLSTQTSVASQGSFCGRSGCISTPGEAPVMSTAATRERGADAGADGEAGASLDLGGAADLPTRLTSLIRDSSALYGAVLRMETLQLSHLQSMVKEAGIRCGRDALVDFCDAQGITWTDPRPKAAKKAKAKKKKTRKRGPGVSRRSGFVSIEATNLPCF
jgi:hypothetical protein